MTTSTILQMKKIVKAFGATSTLKTRPTTLLSRLPFAQSVCRVVRREIESEQGLHHVDPSTSIPAAYHRE